MKIEQNIPIPAPLREPWPFMKMKAGESVLIEDPDKFERAQMAARQAAHRKGLRCACRRVPEGLRIWLSE
jgi:hypothetical protein